MANLIYYYGTMESGKTTKLLQDHYNYIRHNINAVVLKPEIDSKGGNKIISRMGDDLKVDLLVNKECNLLEEEILKNAPFILVDEAQFFTPDQLKDLWYIAHKRNITVIAYGLKNNFMGELFPGSAILFAFSDEKRELTVSCSVCGNIANFNARKENGEYVYDGEEVVIDGSSKKVEYIPLCSNCFLEFVETPRRKKLEENQKNLQRIRYKEKQK